MSSEVTAHRITRPNLVAVGTIVWLSSELMFFAGLFAIYFTTRAVQGPTIWSEGADLLSLPFAAANTTILVLSLMGAFFVAGQVYEYAVLVSEGLTLSSTAYGSIFYVATGFHGLHVTGGLIAFLIVMLRVAKARRFTHSQATTAIVVSYYWHFVDVVWIALFSAIYLIK